MITTKICGITRLEDANFAAENGASAIGYIFYKKSPRYISLNRSKYISDNLKLKGSKVLDLGCGGGLLCEAMTDSGADVVGIDASLKTIEIAKKHANEKNLKIDYLNTNIESFNYKENFDAVICFELIEHVPNPNELIAQISKLIKPNGKLFLSTINRNLYSFMLAKLVAEYLLNVIPRGTHRYEKFIKPSEMRKMLENNIFSISDIQGLKFNPITNAFKLSTFSKINYFITALRNE